MDSISGSDRARDKLLKTALRGFQCPLDSRELGVLLPTYKLEISHREVPLPVLYRFALNLIGLSAYGPLEKVAWYVEFRYKGEACTLAHQKFGLRLYLQTERSADDAHTRLLEIAKKLRQSMPTIEALLNESAPDILQKGEVTLVNQHGMLRRAYEYFRTRSLEHNPSDNRSDSSEVEDWVKNFNYDMQQRLNSFHDMVAAISAYLSLLEHVLVLALPFENYDPSKDSLKEHIGARWGDKWYRVLGKDTLSLEYRQRLTAVVERWRNPYSHGGFEKHQPATLWLQVPDVGVVAAGMTSIRNSPHISLIPAEATDIDDVFKLFDEIDKWLGERLYTAMTWISSGLDVRFDEEFREQYIKAVKRDEYEQFLEHSVYLQEMRDNMDFH